jgi:hypothetical protein
VINLLQIVGNFNIDPVSRIKVFLRHTQEDEFKLVGPWIAEMKIDQARAINGLADIGRGRATGKVKRERACDESEILGYSNSG